MARQVGLKPGENAVYLTPEQIIPRDHLKQTLDNTHELFKKWKQENAIK